MQRALVATIGPATMTAHPSSVEPAITRRTTAIATDKYTLVRNRGRRPATDC
jgi:hypothetical protein